MDREHHVLRPGDLVDRKEGVPGSNQFIQWPCLVIDGIEPTWVMVLDAAGVNRAVTTRILRRIE